MKKIELLITILLAFYFSSCGHDQSTSQDASLRDPTPHTDTSDVPIVESIPSTEQAPSLSSTASVPVEPPVALAVVAPTVAPAVVAPIETSVSAGEASSASSALQTSSTLAVSESTSVPTASIESSTPSTTVVSTEPSVAVAPSPTVVEPSPLISSVSPTVPNEPTPSQSASTSTQTVAVVVQNPVPEIVPIPEPVSEPEMEIFRLADVLDIEKQKAKMVMASIIVDVKDYRFYYKYNDTYKRNDLTKLIENQPPNARFSPAYNSGIAVGLYKPWKYAFLLKDSSMDPLNLQNYNDMVLASDQQIEKKRYSTELIKRMGMFYDDLSSFFPWEKVKKYLTGGLSLCVDMGCGSSLKGHKLIFQGASPQHFHYNPNYYNHYAQDQTYEAVSGYGSVQDTISYREERLADVHEFAHQIIFNEADFGIVINEFKSISWNADGRTRQADSCCPNNSYTCSFSCWNTDSLAKDFVTSYSYLNNYEEDFGDSLGYYVFRRAEFLNKASQSVNLQKKYDWINKNIFKGKEFTNENIKALFPYR